MRFKRKLVGQTLMFNPSQCVFFRVFLRWFVGKLQRVDEIILCKGSCGILWAYASVRGILFSICVRSFLFYSRSEYFKFSVHVCWLSLLFFGVLCLNSICANFECFQMFLENKENKNRKEKNRKASTYSEQEICDDCLAINHCHQKNTKTEITA